MKVETLSDYVYVELWLDILEKTFLLSSKVCEIIYENVQAPVSQDFHHKSLSLELMILLLKWVNDPIAQKKTGTGLLHSQSFELQGI